MLKLAHIINPVIVKESSDLFIAQPITFQTMKTAQEFAQQHDIEVELYSAQYPEDHSIIPDGFIKTPDLDRSILDIADFPVKRKLPLIKDILDRLYEATNADYLIYTNVDIALMPNFYVIVSQMIDREYDAFVINRRTISKDYSKLEEIPLMYAEIGEKHPGHDCFIFPKKVYPSYKLNSVCIGAALIGKALTINQICNSEKFHIFKDLHLTFHLGDDRTWVKGDSDCFTLHNLKDTTAIFRHYKKLNQLSNHPFVLNFSDKIQDENYWLNCAKSPDNIQKLNQKIINNFKRFKKSQLIIKKSIKLIAKQELITNILVSFREKLKQEIQRIFLEEPMIVGPKNRLHISNLAKKNNFLVNTHSGEVYIDDYVFFGKNVCLITGTHDFMKFEEERINNAPKEGRDIVIKKGVWIATNATIIGPCTIGENAVIAAGSVVTKDVLPFTVVAGVPAKTIKHIKTTSAEQKHFSMNLAEKNKISTNSLLL